MKLKKLIKHYLPQETELYIRVVNGNTAVRIVTGIYVKDPDYYSDLLSCKVLQIEPDKNRLLITVTKSKNEIH